MFGGILYERFIYAQIDLDIDIRGSPGEADHIVFTHVLDGTRYSSHVT